VVAPQDGQLVPSAGLPRSSDFRLSLDVTAMDLMKAKDHISGLTANILASATQDRGAAFITDYAGIRHLELS
jgi:hypothetical protein